MKIINNTSYNIPYLESLISLLSIKAMEFHINYIPEIMQTGTLRYLGICKYDKFSNGTVIRVFLEKGNTRAKVLQAICHEFIHIKQYQDGRLRINGNIATFDGVEYDMLEVKYEDRPWEIEAIKEGRKLRKQLRNYKK